MAEEKAPRPIAGDVGTDNRIECEAGHFWVRLWSREAIRSEGAAMGNCLAKGNYDKLGGSDDPTKDGLWSLRDLQGRSVALAHVVKLTSGHLVKTFLGVGNSTASKLAYRQLRHLNAAFEGFESELRYDGVHRDPVIVAPDGKTYRWDRAPEPLRLPDHEARMKARREAGQRRAAHLRRIENGIPAPPGAPPHPRLIEILADVMQTAIETRVWTDAEIGDMTVEEFCLQAAEATSWELPRPLSLARLNEEMRAIIPRPLFEPITEADLDAIRGPR